MMVTPYLPGPKTASVVVSAANREAHRLAGLTGCRPGGRARASRHTDTRLNPDSVGPGHRDARRAVRILALIGHPRERLERTVHAVILNICDPDTPRHVQRVVDCLEVRLSRGHMIDH